jgi:lambda repressor-like predicted transcriptional regulator
MNTTAAPNDMTSATSLLVENVRIYLQVKSAFDQCDEEIQSVVTDMIDIVRDEEATADERQRAMYTIIEALFPSLAFDFLSNCDKVRFSKEAKEQWEEMAEQEASFSERLASLMKKKDITQEQLGKLIGVGQSAIANLLNRNCRPQRKTVARIAEAMGVPPQELWPNINS